jgi:hypothetical protein
MKSHEESPQAQKLLSLFRDLIQGRCRTHLWHEALREARNLSSEDLARLKSTIDDHVARMCEEGREQKYFDNYRKLISALRRNFCR